MIDFKKPYNRQSIRVIIFVALMATASSLALPVFAQSQFEEQGPFSLQVAPSPIVETIKPGQNTVKDLKIHNTNTKKENLKMTLRGFTIDNSSGDVKLNDDVPKEILDWVTFSDPLFQVEPGEWFNQRINFNPPANAGFSYNFAITISRASPTQSQSGKQSIEGSIAVFTLLSIDRPDAKREVEILKYESKRRLYEFLPAHFSINIKNTGNTQVQPFGNIYIQRSSSDTKPIEVLPLNATAAHILPGVSRTLNVDWSEGFPSFVKNKSSDNVAETTKLNWDWGNIQNFRFGHYVAKVVAVYNDGTRDVPVEASIGFWVIPWKLLAGLFLLIIILGIGMFSIIKKSIGILKRGKKKPEPEV